VARQPFRCRRACVMVQHALSVTPPLFPGGRAPGGRGPDCPGDREAGRASRREQHGIRTRCRPGRTRYEVRTTVMPARVGMITSAP
jgi:hypothetical protein